MRLSTIFTISSIFSFASTNVHGCGLFEFFNFEDLPTGVMEAAMALGYDNMTWSEVGTNPVEYLRFDDVLANIETETKVGTFVPISGDVTATLMTLDLFDDVGLCWDFYINHYGGYAWADLSNTYTPFNEDVQSIVEFIGWNETTWDDTSYTSAIPPSECMNWDMLDPIHKWAYHAIGWDPVTWDDAPCDPRCPISEVCP